MWEDIRYTRETWELRGKARKAKDNVVRSGCERLMHANSTVEPTNSHNQYVLIIITI